MSGSSPTGRKALRVKDVRPRSILTGFGEVALARRVYTDEFGDRRTCLDEIVALRPRKRGIAGRVFRRSRSLAPRSLTSVPPVCCSGTV